MENQKFITKVRGKLKAYIGKSFSENMPKRNTLSNSQKLRVSCLSKKDHDLTKSNNLTEMMIAVKKDLLIFQAQKMVKK